MTDLKRGDDVLKCSRIAEYRKGQKRTSETVLFAVSAQSFSNIDFKGVTILSGTKYYIDKAVECGATKPVKKKAKKAE